MNGTLSAVNSTTPLLQKITKVVSKQEKIKNNLLLIAGILLSNLFFYLFFWQDSGTQAPNNNADRFVSHQNYEKIILPLNVIFIIQKNATEIPVTIYGQENQVLTEKAYLHQEILSTSANNTGDEFSTNHKKQYIVEVHQDEVLSLISSIQNNDISLIATPFINNQDTNFVNSTKENRYEIKL